MKQLEFNFNRSVQLEIPFTQSVSENQEKTEQAKRDLASWLLSRADQLLTRAELERLKQTPVTPQQ